MPVHGQKCGLIYQVRWTDQTDHLQIDQIDHLDPSLPLSDAVQDRYGTDLNQETRALLEITQIILYGSHAAT